MSDEFPRVFEQFPRGLYIDRTNGDMWAQKGSDRESWIWINGDRWLFVPRENLEFHTELPPWY